MASTVLGIDVGGSGIKGAVVDTADGKLLSDRHRVKTPQPATREAVAEAVATMVHHFGWDGPLGCTMPARIRRGVAKTAVNIDQAWLGTDARALFANTTGLPAHVINDADAAGLAEMAFGAGRGQDGTVLVLTIGTGIGSALFVDGRLVPNTELGHLRLDGSTFEEYASNATRKRHGLGWAKWARRLQRGLQHAEFLFAPDLLVLGGGVSRPQRWEKFSHLLETDARIVPAVLENEAGLVGAALAATTALSSARQ